MTDNTCPSTLTDINLKALPYDLLLLMTSAQPLNLKTKNVSGHSLRQSILWHFPSKMHGQYLIDNSNLVLSQQEISSGYVPMLPTLTSFSHFPHFACAVVVERKSSAWSSQLKSVWSKDLKLSLGLNRAEYTSSLQILAEVGPYSCWRKGTTKLSI